MNANWEYLATLFFVLTFVFVIFMTIGFFINYKRDQKNRMKKVEINPVNGRFFQRYIPDELFHKYSKHFDIKS